jgi:hypothetical protein
MSARFLDTVRAASVASDLMQRIALAAARGLATAVGILLCALPGRAAWAGDNDIVLSRLGDMAGGAVVGNRSDFRSLVSELGVVHAPRLLSPADTLGFGGFQFTTDLGFTTIDSGAGYWRARAGSLQPTGPGPHGGSMMPTLGVFARKGMWFPVPSFEIGGGLVHLLGSRMSTGQVYAKLALHEGYHEWPLPSLAVRGAVSRMMGESDLDLTVVSLDASAGKEVGIGGTFNFTPYGGYALLIIIPRSELIDATPQIGDDPNMTFVFTDQDDILRHRLFAGARLRYSIVALTLEGQFALAGTSVDGFSGAQDGASGQLTITTSLGVDF